MRDYGFDLTRDCEIIHIGFETKKPVIDDLNDPITEQIKICNNPGAAEFDKCDFCNEEKHVSRTYLYPDKYKKPEKLEDRVKLYNEGSYFIIIKTCNDCGKPVNA